MKKLPELTRRERDVLVALCRPLARGAVFTEPASIREVADTLGVSEAAVKQHLANLYDKFGIFEGSERRRVRLANVALSEGAVPREGPFSDDVLLTAIRQAIERRRTALRQASEMRALRDAYASLSRREREVMALVVSGLLNKQVGAELGISEITVKAHRGKMMRKINAGSLPELVRMAERFCLTPSVKG